MISYILGMTQKLPKERRLQENSRPIACQRTEFSGCNPILKIHFKLKNVFVSVNYEVEKFNLNLLPSQQRISNFGQTSRISRAVLLK